jgi:nucleoside-diphosphate-sugar epimerase/uncharacterized protein (DUF952 family)
VRILVTGSSGQLGREIARQLAADHEVRGLDLRPGVRTTHVGCITDRELVARAIEGVEGVVHTASLHAPHVGRASADEFRRVNVDGTRALLEAAARRRVARFVYSSSTSIYGHAMVSTGPAVWVTEELAPRPRDIYDETKLAAENLCRAFAAEGAFPATCLRVSRFFPEDGGRVAAHRLHRGIDVRDAARGHLAALASPRPRFAIYNLSGGSDFTPDDLPALGRDAPEVIERRHPSLRHQLAARGWRLPASIDRVYVIDKIAAELGFSPAHGIQSLLAHTDRWLYHLVAATEPRGELYAPASLGTEGFVHCSYQPAVADTARTYFPPDIDLEVLQIDPRRLGAAIEVAQTPRGAMPHVFGPIRAGAVVAALRLVDVDRAPDPTG